MSNITDSKEHFDADAYSAAKSEYKRQKELKKADFRARAKEAAKDRNAPPVRPLLEEIGNSVSHGIGAGLAVAGLILLLLKSDTGMKLLASLFYGICLIALFLFSCLYHSFKSGSTVKRVFRRFDYSSIYLLIGGTFAPFFLVYWGDRRGIIFFCVQWGIILLGITLIAVFGPGSLKKMHFVLYLLLGWSGLMFLPDFYRNDFSLIIYLVGGGLLYTIGCIPFKMRATGAHFIWHFFVIAGAVVHWFGVYLCVYT